MDKIKQNIGKDVLEQIRERIFHDPISRAKTRLDVAKNVFIFSAFLYFLSILMAVSGFLPAFCAAFAFFFYPLFVFSVLALLYGLINYALTIYFERFLFLRYIAFGIFTVLFLIVVVLHLGVYPL